MIAAEDFIKLGFNRNEARVYVSLIKFGKTDAHQLVKDTKFHKNIVYDNLDKLINKGLVRYIVEDGKRFYAISSPEMLIKSVEESIDSLKQKKDFAVKLSKDIEKRIKIVPHKQEASVFRGQNGIRAYHNEIIREGKEFFVFGAPKQSVDIMGENFWENFQVKRIDKKIKARMIFNFSLRSFGDALRNKYTDVRYFEGNFEPLTQTDVHENKIAIIVWTETPVLFIIEDKDVAASYRSYFEKMWKKAKT